MKKVYTKYKKAYHEYEMIDSYEAGIVLTGAEVKSIRSSHVNLLGSFVYIKDNNVVLKQCHISKPDNLGYNSINFDELRERKLLLNKSEIKKIKKKLQEPGISLIVTEIYQRDKTNNIKCVLNLAKGRKLYDKREALKKKTLIIQEQRERSY